ncbi:MAG TPA: rhodanese-like domain-containing protein, partial [Thermoplasmata archaeon]|nr:rhodanese-like domain-containing protein [Thermoplasmata archaeon]
PTQRGLIDYPAFCGVTETVERVPEVDASALAEELRGDHPPALVDVREPGEWAIAHLPHARLVPKGSLAARFRFLPKQRAIVVYCKSGRRSADAARFLLDHGFPNVRSLRRGIDAWAETVDPSMPRY